MIFVPKSLDSDENGGKSYLSFLNYRYYKIFLKSIKTLYCVIASKNLKISKYILRYWLN